MSMSDDSDNDIYSDRTEEDNYDDADDLDIDKEDPEYFEYELLQVEDVERLLNEEMEVLCSALKIHPHIAKILLHVHGWKKDSIIEQHKRNLYKLLIDSNIVPFSKHREDAGVGQKECSVCFEQAMADTFSCLTCGHIFCKNCWDVYFQIQIKQGITTGIQCMQRDCHILVPEDFLCNALSTPELRVKYKQLSFQDHVNGHHELRFCPGPNCAVIVRSKEFKAKKVECSYCKTTFCFQCGINYHAPTDCETIKTWLKKRDEDWKTEKYKHDEDWKTEKYKYIPVTTKYCPKCHVCIEKIGGCNHMQCTNCKFAFSWMCLGDSETQGSDRYECSRYEDDLNNTKKSDEDQAIQKDYFYVKRYENHAKSLQLEEQTLQRITSKIQDKVMKNTGTWIDWQFLLDAATLLKKCRYTLQYSYPYAYYMEEGVRKELFEYQQAELEAVVENLSWKVERAEITDRVDIVNQMDMAEKRRLALLKDFLEI